MKTLYFLLSTVLIGIICTEINSPYNKTINVIVKTETGNSTIPSKKLLEETKALSEDLLTELHKNRHDDLIKRIESLTLSKDQVEAIKNEAIVEWEKRKGKPRFDKQEVQAEIDKINAMTSRELKKQLEVTVTNSKKYDTVAVHLSLDEKKKYLAIAANIKTIHIDDLHNPKMWQAVLTNDNNYIFEHRNLGLNAETDLVSIETVLSKKKYQSWGEDGYTVHLVTPDPNNKYPELKASQVLPGKLDNWIEVGKTPQTLDNYKKLENEIIQKKLLGFNQQIKNAKKPDKLTKAIKAKENAEHILRKDLDARVKAIRKLQVDINSQPHAEMQLRQHREILEFKVKDSVFSPSKAPCEKCGNFVRKKHSSIDMGDKYNLYDRRGLEEDKIKNWADPDNLHFKVVHKTMDEWKAEVDAAKHSNTKSTDTVSSASCSPGSRRKRSVGTGRGCVFVVTDLREKTPTNKQLNNLDKINSKEFMTEYVAADTKNQRAMVEIAEAHKHKLVGSPEDIEKVTKIVKYEKLKKHNFKKEYAENAVHRGEFFGDKVKTNGYTESELLKDTKLSPTKTSKTFQLGKGVENAGKVSNVLGKFLLAKSIVSGIANGDTTGLAVMGGRIGGEMSLELIAKFGGQAAAKLGSKLGIKAAAKVAGSSFKLLGKAAGPLGSIADIGLSGWGISKSVKRLNDPDATKFEQNEAIADIVQDSIDIAITAVVTVASIAFPPLAPLFVVVGFLANLFVTATVLVYKAANHLDSLNSKIKLLDYEKSREVEQYITGQDTSEYITNLIKAKAANDFVVNETVAFLELNPDVIGRVIPSRTFEIDAGCELQKNHLVFNAYPSLLGFLPRLETQTLATNCYKGGECKDSVWRCINHQEEVLPWATARDSYECSCKNNEPQTVKGNPHSDSKVDLRQKTNVYTERDAPDPPNDHHYTNICVPSSKDFRGDWVSNRDATSGYLCENAIAVKRVDGKGKFMLFELEDGNDEVYLDTNDPTNNYFVVKDGHKTFHGSAGQDTFVISGPCKNLNGSLNGEKSKEQNTLVVNRTCAPDKPVSIDLQTSKFTSEDLAFMLKVENIQIVYGRSNESDLITTRCDTKYVEGGGGKSASSPDIVTVPKYASCNYSLTVVSAEYTNIKTWATNGQVAVIVPRGKDGIHLSYADGNDTGRTVFLFKMPVSLVSATSFESVSENQIKLDLVIENIQNVEIEMQPLDRSLQYFQADILFEETDGAYSNIVIDKTKGPTALHTFEKLSESTKTRLGAKVIPNNFRLIGGNWAVKGGDFDDEFILADPHFTGEIFGEGGVNNFYLDSNLAGSLITMDFGTGFISGFHPTNASLKFSNIHRIFGRLNGTESIKCGCLTKFVSGGGGRSSLEPDIIELPDSGNCIQDLTIIASGHTRTNTRVSKGQVVISIPKENGTNCNSQCLLDEATIIYNLDFPVNSLKLLSCNVNEDSLGFLLILSTFENQMFELFVNVAPGKSSLFAKDEHWSQPIIQLEELHGSPSSLLIHKLTGSVTSYHRLESGSNLTREGSQITSNYFQLLNGTWTVVGGPSDDEFVLYEGFSGTLEGKGGVNTLHLDNSIVTDMVSVDFQTKIISQGAKRVEFNDLQRIYGRLNKTDEIICDCKINFVAGNGGEITRPDLITIPKLENCVIYLTVAASGITDLRSQATEGKLLVYIKVGENGELNFNANFIASSSFQPLFALNFQSRSVQKGTCKIVDRNEQRFYTLNLQLTQNQLVEFDFEALDQTESGTFLQMPQIMFVNDKFETESNILIEKATGNLLIMHILNKTTHSEERYGSLGLPNLFKLVGSTWSVYGGIVDDTFILHTSEFAGLISGGDGYDSLLIQDEIIAPFVEVDLINKEIRGLEGNLSIENIEVIRGRSGKKDDIYCNCATKLVKMEGGAGVNLEDTVTVGSDLNCSSMELKIYVPRFTKVQNSAWVGNFTYIISDEDHFEINTQINEKSNHFYQFQFGFSKIRSASFDSSSKKISFNTKSKNKFSLQVGNAVSDSHQYSHPVLQFIDSDEKGNSFKGDVWVMTNGDIYSSIKVVEPFTDAIYGLHGSKNQILVNVSTDVNLGQIVGGNLDDSFWLASVQSVDTIDGGYLGTNSLTLLSEYRKGQSLTVDLHQENGKISIYNTTGTPIVHSLKNIQMFRGREESFDEVYVNCGTRLVENADIVWVTNYDCLNYDMTISIGENTKMNFSNPEVKPDTKISGSFYYKFETLRTFNVLFDYPEFIRQTKQIFYLKFDIDDLVYIFFSQIESKVFYVISNNTYEHFIDPHLEYHDQQFHSQPQLMSSDGFHIQIDRQGEILMTASQTDVETSLNDIQNKLVPLYENIGTRLEVSLIVKTKSDFIYVGDGWKDSDSEVPNILTNTDQRSHLVGSGGSHTVYVILDLQQDVYIYTGFTDDTLDKVQTIDLTEVVWKIRNDTQSKYVPKVRETSEGNLEIYMEGFEDEFPGRVILVNIIKYFNQLQILLNAVVMKLEKVSSLTESRLEKPSAEEIWILKPVPIVIPKDSVSVLTADDFEDGQKVIHEGNDQNFTFSGISEFKSIRFELLRNKGNLVVTNLASIASIANLSEVVTFIMLDFYNETTSSYTGVGSFEGMTKYATVRDWKYVLKESEHRLLQGLPEIPPEF